MNLCDSKNKCECIFDSTAGSLFTLLSNLIKLFEESETILLLIDQKLPCSNCYSIIHDFIL